ncbi:hypothetical protein CYFUS_001696 [Cystobacter fuscus]|uniref:Uncharacterized protein n=1 Tax=Cystobacter fuscus TaxID=43 RepID=A0A250IYH6_9BACT|nr:hypothetical protein [Cystobacter fuscus]ATB36282.1 hypothetical protein CYFUS_001696 [Cystobacter fuscus]
MSAGRAVGVVAGALLGTAVLAVGVGAGVWLSRYYWGQWEAGNISWLPIIGTNKSPAAIKRWPKATPVER